MIINTMQKLKNMTIPVIIILLLTLFISFKHPSFMCYAYDVQGWTDLLEAERTSILKLTEKTPWSLGHNVWLNADHSVYHSNRRAWLFRLGTVHCSDPTINLKLQGALPNMMPYLSIAEYLYFLPNHHTYHLSLNDNIDIARLLQFFEVTRYLDSFYFNYSFDSQAFRKFFISVSPRYIKIYSEYGRLLCITDRLKNTMLNFGRSDVSTWNFSLNLKRTWNSFIKFLIPTYRADTREHALQFDNRDDNYPYVINVKQRFTTDQRWFYETKVWNFFSKKNVFNMKYKEMKNQGLDPDDKIAWKNYSYDVVEVINPTFIKWKRTQFFEPRNITYDAVEKKLAPNSARHMLNNYGSVDTIKQNINLLLQDCLSFVQELNYNQWQKTDEFTQSKSSDIPKNRNIVHDISDETPFKIDLINDESILQMKIKRNFDYLDGAHFWNSRKALKPKYYTNTISLHRDSAFYQHILGLKSVEPIEIFIDAIQRYKKKIFKHGYSLGMTRKNIEDNLPIDDKWSNSSSSYNIQDFLYQLFLSEYAKKSVSNSSFEDMFNSLIMNPKLERASRLLMHRTFVNNLDRGIDVSKLKSLKKLTPDRAFFYYVFEYAKWYSREWGKAGEMDFTSFSRVITKMEKVHSSALYSVGLHQYGRFIFQLYNRFLLKYHPFLTDDFNNCLLYTSPSPRDPE